MLRAQDVLLLLRLSLLPPDEKSKLQDLSTELGLSLSAVHASIERCKASSLIVPTRWGKHTIDRANVTELMLSGVKYFFPARRGALSRGIPTAHAAPPLNAVILSADAPPVWPHARGTVRGEAFEPLYPSAPDAALANPALYELLTLLDAVRGGAARERKLAATALEKRLSDR